MGRKKQTHQRRAIRPGGPEQQAASEREHLIRAIQHYARHPVDFVRDMLNAEPDPWQKDVLNALATKTRVAVRSGRGVGKSALMAWAIIWFTFTRPHARIPATAPGRAQLEDVLWAEVAKWLNQSKVAPYLRWTKTKLYMVGHEDTWFAVTRTAAKPEALQGFHAEHQLWVLDEASGIPDDFMEAIEGALTGGSENKILMCGNPTQLSGFFYRAFHEDADLYETFQVSCEDSSRVDPSYIERMRRFGEDHDAFRVHVLGEFPRGGENTFLNFGDVYNAMGRDVPAGQPVEMGIDVARFGSDYTVFAVRKGMKLLPLEVRGGWDTVQTAEFAAELVSEHKVARIKIDDTGVGGGVTDNLRRLQREGVIPRYVDIVPVNNGGKGDDFYENTGALSWGQFNDLLPHIGLPEDNDLFAELTDRRKDMTPKGKIRLEPKSAMKARGQQSPDRADAAVLAFFQATTPPVDPSFIGRAFTISNRRFWVPSRWRRAV